MSNKFLWEGLNELRLALRSLPADLAAEAGALVAGTAERAAASVRAAYHTGPTGNLKGRVIVTMDRNPYGVNATVKNRAPHAWMYESGTGATGPKGRARKTSKGWNRGSTPRYHTFVDTMQPARRSMQAGLIAIVERAGITVSRA